MASPSSMNLYICANALLLVAVACLAGIRGLSPRLERPIAYRHQLRLGEVVALAAVLLPFLASFFSTRGSFLPQTAQVWSAPTMLDGARFSPEVQRTAVSLVTSGASLPLEVVSRVVTGVFLAGMLIVLIRLATEAATTLQIISDAQLIRRHRASRILSSDRVRVPFSFWLPGRYFIVVPSALVLSCEDLKMAIRHEAQHHRQQDTKSLYLYQVLKAAFFWNPAVHRLERQLRELQEFACDEALGAQRSLCARTYCQCLLRVAREATRQARAAIHAGMLDARAGSVLKRRIEAILTRPAGYSPPSALLAAGGLALALLATTAFAFTSPIHDRRISAERAEAMAAVAREVSTFPIAVNDRVVKQLNRLLSTPDGRAHLQESLERMESYRAFLSDELERHGLPLELLAVPLVESGYRNQPQDDNPRHGAGLWMFIAPTARRFGLTVNAAGDERLDVAAETSAAMRMFSKLYLQFNDWGLALLAYNAGSVRVERAIRETGSRDVWALTAKGHENDVDYVPLVMAAILILWNPGVLD